MERINEMSPRNTARMAGLFYLITVITRIVADGFVRDRLVVAGDAATTANNLLANAALFRLGFVADIFAFASYVVLTALLYQLLKPVSKNLSLVAAFFGLVASIGQAFSSVFHLAALFVLGGSESLRAFSTAQLQSMALLLLKLRAIGYHNVGLVFLGFYLLLIGVLLFRSTFVPRTIGFLVVLAGLAYLPFLYPPLAGALLPKLLIPAGVGQIALTFWLLIKGVNPQRWAERAAAAVDWPTLRTMSAEPLAH
jgi:hypothetical protein